MNNHNYLKAWSALWLGGWLMRHLASEAATQSIVRYRHGDEPNIYWHRCGPREHVVYVVR